MMKGHCLDKLAKGVVTGARRPVILKGLTGSASERACTTGRRRTLAARALTVGVLMVGLSILALLVSGQAALAAPPPNDTLANAKEVTIGFSEELDTTEATTDSDDDGLRESCGVPATDASVWYVLQGSDQWVGVRAEADYPTGVLVAEGIPGHFFSVMCGGVFFAEAGVTYYVLVSDLQYDDVGNGGLLNISFKELMPPTLDFTVNRIGRVNSHTGVATISGTYTCTNGDYLEVYVADVRQNVGRVAIFGSNAFRTDEGTCDGTTHSWSVDILPGNGRFAGGKALVRIDVSTCGVECISVDVEQTVQLRGGKK